VDAKNVTVELDRTIDLSPYDEPATYAAAVERVYEDFAGLDAALAERRAIT
jgi:hypothetical protein